MCYFVAAMSSISRRREPKRPTIHDLRWFAGFFAGDGSICGFKGKDGDVITCIIMRGGVRSFADGQPARSVLLLRTLCLGVTAAF